MLVYGCSRLHEISTSQFFVDSNLSILLLDLLVLYWNCYQLTTILQNIFLQLLADSGSHKLEDKYSHWTSGAVPFLLPSGGVVQLSQVVLKALVACDSVVN